MKISRALLTLILSAVISTCSLTPAHAFTTEEIKDGDDKRETIVIELPTAGTTNITYVAETAIGMSQTDALWVCSKIIEISDGGTNTTIITVMPTLQAPGTNGVNLATFNYPNG
jgi:hypothetical protein